MPKSKPKAVKAWAIWNTGHEMFRADLYGGPLRNRKWAALDVDEEWIRVEIRPLPVKPRKARRKA